MIWITFQIKYFLIWLFNNEKQKTAIHKTRDLGFLQIPSLWHDDCLLYYYGDVLFNFAKMSTQTTRIVTRKEAEDLYMKIKQKEFAVVWRRQAEAASDHMLEHAIEGEFDNYTIK